MNAGEYLGLFIRYFVIYPKILGLHSKTSTRIRKTLSKLKVIANGGCGKTKWE